MASALSLSLTPPPPQIEDCVSPELLAVLLRALSEALDSPTAGPRVFAFLWSDGGDFKRIMSLAGELRRRQPGGRVLRSGEMVCRGIWVAFSVDMSAFLRSLACHRCVHADGCARSCR
jgi:hypothetical protein